MPKPKTQNPMKNVNSISREADRFLSMLKRDLIRQQRVLSNARRAKVAVARRADIYRSPASRSELAEADKNLDKAIAAFGAQQTAVEHAQRDLKKARSEERVIAIEEAYEDKIAKLRERIEAKALADVNVAVEKFRARWMKGRLKQDEAKFAVAERREHKRLAQANEKERKALQGALSGRKKPGPQVDVAVDAAPSKKPATNGRRKPGRPPQPAAAKPANGRRKPGRPPSKPAAMPNKPANGRRKPGRPPSKPAAMPNKPANGRRKPGRPPSKPAAMPNKPAAMPNKPAAMPNTPAETPNKPAETPQS